MLPGEVVVVPARECRAGLPSWHHPTYDALLRQAVDVQETGLTTSDSAAHMAGSEILVGLAGQLLARSAASRSARWAAVGCSEASTSTSWPMLTPRSLASSAR